MSDSTVPPRADNPSVASAEDDDPVFELDAHGLARARNSAACRLLGGAAASPLADHLMPADRAAAAAALPVGLPADVRFSAEPRRWWWMRPRRTPEEDGSRLVVAVEVTTRRDAEAAARQGAIDLVLSALDEIRDAFVIYDRDGRLTVCNRRFRDLYGYSEDEAAPGVHFRTLGEIDMMRGSVVTPEGADAEAYLARKAEYRRTLKGTFEVQLKNGRWLETRDRRTADGGFVSIQTDITKRRAAESALVAAKERAEEALAEVGSVNAQLEQFAYVASHDLREPLRMVTAYLDLLERRCADLLNADGREFIAHARGGAKRMDALILDLLAYTRVGRSGQADGPVDAGTLLAAVRANLDLAVSESGATIRLPDSPPPVTGCEPELTSLFQNLIGNALKYRHADRAPVVTVTAEADAAAGRVWFAVADNGIGIAPEYHDRIFQLFQRLHPREAYSGTGMGLALCRKIVERHGGQIGLASQAGEGSTFRFDLPLAR
ncbi:Two-component sensor histidine kinase [Caenispirillum salinarum AK4]|uniref:histidine kinase n=1 Tax=Caenispirillum salinarum AK4 TaxID=1238182 RepID=K9H0J3_9PROT|nr:PAS domain-containing sensor histidine kinase [Caenispirillum salinarum]EKV30559.1 Two-component sensor histidine kinase [Caenispirillum salinarum AK4]